MYERAQAAFHVADGSGADAGSLGKLLLRHAGLAAQAFQRRAQSLVDVTQIGDSNGE
jgi:hypothetical protein